MTSAALLLLARRVLDRDPGALDRAVRRLARSPRARRARPLLALLFPIGLPGGYIPIAYATAFWVQSRRRHGAPSILASAWLGWLVHRATKVVFVRARPGANADRTDSFPSGHTTGITALALTIAHVLAREGLVSREACRTLGLSAPALMGANRVATDEHWATDVFGGWLLGAAIASVVCAISDY